MSDIYRILEREHRDIEGLLDELVTGSSDRPAQALLLDRLVVRASRHEAGEEMALWPAVGRHARGGARLAEDGLRQEQDARYVLDALRAETDAGERLVELQQLATLMRRHIRFEEQEVWPSLKRGTGPLAGRLLGARLGAGGVALPTRPHPGGSQRPLGLATAGAVAALGDRFRDRMSGRARRTREDGAGSGQEADSFIVAEHARMDGLLSEVESQEWPTADLVSRVVRELSVHDSIERQYLYPLLRLRLEGGNELYARWMEEHGRIAAVLADVDRRADHDRHRRDLMHELVPLVRTHMVEEEEGVLPAMRARLARAEMVELGDRLAEAKAKAPTRPHSHIAGAGLGARVSRALVGPWDRTRDALSGRR